MQLQSKRFIAGFLQDSFPPRVAPWTRARQFRAFLRCPPSQAAGKQQHYGMKEAPVGDWDSPISSEQITATSVRLGSAKVAADGFIYYLESRPAEAGRSVLMRQRVGAEPQQLTPGPESGLNIRTRVHEYGGGDTTLGDGVVYFSNFKDQRLYKQIVSPTIQEPTPVTPEGCQLRCADGVLDGLRNRLIVVQEDHSGSGEPINSLAAIDLQSGKSTTLVSGNDFYANPALSSDGSRLAWVTWNHPNMPWDDTEVWAGNFGASGAIEDSRKVAGGEDESVLQPTWTKENKLIFISDSSGWYNLYIEAKPGSIEALLPMAAEFAGPAWMLGGRSYVLLNNDRLLVQHSDPKAASQTLSILDMKTGATRGLQKPYAALGSLSALETGDSMRIATVGASPDKPSAVIALDCSADGLADSTAEQWQVLKKSSAVEVDQAYVSKPQTIEFPTADGETAYMYFYPPTNKTFRLPDGSLPPLLVKIHGGPTAQASTAFNPLYQYWTSRGFAISDVNYGGSTGYGRAYRQRLKRRWGIVDVDDCANAATFLANEALVDRSRLCIDGGSAGGYTTLAALAFRDVFSAGASLYGVADCELLAQETHKFESRYLDGLIGALPEHRDIYKARSPIHSVDKIRAPIIFFQGTEDKVVPPKQAINMFEQLKSKGVATALVLFEGEQHGFRGTDAIRRALDGEFYFFGKVLGFKAEMPQDLAVPEIVNL